MRRLPLLFACGICLMLAGSLGRLTLSDSAHAKGKPAPPDKWDVAFVVDGGYGSEIIGSALEAASKSYETSFGTGNVAVTLSKSNRTIILDDNAYLRRFNDDVTGERFLVFRIGVQGGHPVKDRYSTPTPTEKIGGDPVIPFPEVVWDSGNGDPDPGLPSLEVVAGSVDANLDMEPGSHVILHLHVDGIPLIGMSGKNAGEVIGNITVGDLEFSFPAS